MNKLSLKIFLRNFYATVNDCLREYLLIRQKLQEAIGEQQLRLVYSHILSHT